MRRMESGWSWVKQGTWKSNDTLRMGHIELRYILQDVYNTAISIIHDLQERRLQSREWTERLQP